MEARLRVQRGARIGEVFEVSDGGEVVIGRKDDTAICIPHRQVSRRHCRIVNGQGDLVLYDLGSRNGTRVNGKRVRIATSLIEGDVVEIVGTRLLVEMDRSPAEAEYRRRASTIDTGNSDAWIRLAQWCDKSELKEKAEECRERARALASRHTCIYDRDKWEDYRQRLQALGFAACSVCRLRGGVDSEHVDCLGTGVDLASIALPDFSDEDSASLAEVRLEDLEHVDMLGRIGMLGAFIDPRRVMSYPAPYRRYIGQVSWLTRIWRAFARELLERMQLRVTEETVDALLQVVTEQTLVDWRRLTARIHKLRHMPKGKLLRLTPDSLRELRQNPILWSIVEERYAESERQLTMDGA